ncbi:hypothetical protein G7074_25450 [Pedobacter sp. HDW13]|uniref:hypothetical protein n=1 Tax=unclassified Pedobacter TaxID=2628915 RepID=UPI000F592C98|nr:MULTISPECIES: hypothetical protein [unclassified Pedobacter]QIL42309.1 hypothetical protein G7074_25450 [Pedobacter sp. HDW13]RQO76448.1 hypothetical protein DBR40_11100 [Pedobacter sp. KBW01]
MGRENIIITGRFPSSDFSLLREVLKFDVLNKLEVILYCLYSEYEIPLGTIFNRIENMSNQIVFEGQIELTNVTEQYLKPFDCIPMGWATICKFKFQDQIPLALFELPEVSWDEAVSSLRFKV